jgi:hypothetical protein
VNSLEESVMDRLPVVKGDHSRHAPLGAGGREPRRNDAAFA